jgi:hypothetical protein
MRRNNYPQKMEEVRNAFVRYLLKIDAGCGDDTDD